MNRPCASLHDIRGRLCRRGVLLVLVALVGLAYPVRAHAQSSGTESDQESSQRFHLTPAAYLQLDVRSFPDWPVVPGTGRLERDTTEVRRLRGALDGEWRRLSFEIAVDPQESDDSLIVKDAYAQMRIGKSLKLRAGQFKLPGSREYSTSARQLDFLERSAMASTIAPGRDIGAVLTGRRGKHLDYQIGGFAGDGRGRASRSAGTVIGRVEWDRPRDLRFGGWISVGRTSAVDREPANGFEGRASSGYRYFERLYVQGVRLRLGGNIEWSPGRWRIVAEGLRARDERQQQGLDHEDLPALVAHGGSLAVKRHFGTHAGKGHVWDASLRYDVLALDDEGPETERDSVRPRATDVRAKASHGLTLGASWTIARWVRLLGDASVERFSEQRSAPEAGRRSGYFTFATRLQFELP